MVMRTGWAGKLAGVVLLWGLLLGPQMAEAAFYKCYRADGKVYYTDKGCGNDLRQPPGSTQQRPVAGPAPVAPPASSQPVAPPPGVASAPPSAAPAAQPEPAEVSASTEDADDAAPADEEKISAADEAVAKKAIGQMALGLMMMFVAVIIMTVDAWREDRKVLAVVVFLIQPAMSLIYPLFFKRTLPIFMCLGLYFAGGAVAVKGQNAAVEMAKAQAAAQEQGVEE